MKPAKLLATPADAVRMTGLSLRILQRLRAGGDGPIAVSLTGRRIGYPVADLRAWIKSRPSTRMENE